MPSRTRLAALLALTFGLALVIACSDDSAAAPTAAPTAEPTAAPTAEVSPTATEAPVTATPTPTATPDDEPVASTAAIATEDLPRVRFTTAGGAMAELPIEVPPRSEYRIGLSGRHELGGRGMLFYYPGGEHTGGFWMRNTHVDLDIAFVDADLEIIAVLQMEAETEEIHRPGRPYLAAIEAPLGWYESHDIGAGATVEFLFEIPEHLQDQ